MAAILIDTLVRRCSYVICVQCACFRPQSWASSCERRISKRESLHNSLSCSTALRWPAACHLDPQRSNSHSPPRLLCLSTPPTLPLPPPCCSGSLFSGIEPTPEDGRTVIAVCTLSVIFLAFSSMPQLGLVFATKR